MTTQRRHEDPAPGERLDALLADCNNEWEQLTALEAYLEDQLQFPFRAGCDAPPEPGSLGIVEGDRVTVFDLLESDRQQGIMVRVKKGERIYRCPLFRLHALKASTPEAQPLLDYRTWFRTVGLPEAGGAEDAEG
jgi:hypothetical protein